MSGSRVIVLVDGEHYPPVVRTAIGEIRARGDEIAAAIFLGGVEKIKHGDLAASYGVEVRHGEDREALLAAVLDETGADGVIDLSDEPVVTSPSRFRLASIVLSRGAWYAGADFELRPPRMHDVLTKPSIRVIATGKRTGKTAVAAALARHAAAVGRRPVIVAMGRGGPDRPDVVEAGAGPGPADLLALADAGRHAASDYLEDAVTARVTTIGCRRVAGGLSGGVFSSNVVEGARIAEDRPEDLVILEGSGAAIPPVRASAGLFCVPATAEGWEVEGYLGPLRVLLSDLAVVTMAEEAAPAAAVESTIRRVSPSIDIIRTVLRPNPLTEVGGRRIFYSCTAPPRVENVLRRHLEEAHGCEVVAMSFALADRDRLRADMAASPPFDVLVTEIKAAAIDVAVRAAAEAGKDVVFADNEPTGDGVREAFDRLLALAATRT